ncbi:MAG: hypothetical protein WAT92_17825 [Saprospiraceae bacterium]
MEASINRLLGILNRYSVEDINRIYRDKEVELEIESFTKHPDVRWSDSLKKKMIQAAKRKRISAGRIKYLESQIDNLNSYIQEEHVKIALDDVIKMLKNLENAKLANSDPFLLHIEFDQFQPKAFVHAYGNYKNELGSFESSFFSAKYWVELNSSRFISMSEQLEIIEIEGEEYPQILAQIRELRVFQAIKKAMEQSSIKEKINTILPHGKIVIGFHDTKFYTIHESGHAK